MIPYTVLWLILLPCVAVPLQRPPPPKFDADCNRKLSREASLIAESDLALLATTTGVPLSPLCPLLPERNRYAQQELLKQELRHNLWQCGACGKQFRSEWFIDWHMSRSHADNDTGTGAPTAAGANIATSASAAASGICFADYCGMLGCPSLTSDTAEADDEGDAADGDVSENGGSAVNQQQQQGDDPVAGNDADAGSERANDAGGAEGPSMPSSEASADSASTRSLRSKPQSQAALEGSAGGGSGRGDGGGGSGGSRLSLGVQPDQGTVEAPTRLATADATQKFQRSSSASSGSRVAARGSDSDSAAGIGNSAGSVHVHEGGLLHSTHGGAGIDPKRLSNKQAAFRQKLHCTMVINTCLPLPEDDDAGNGGVGGSGGDGASGQRGNDGRTRSGPASNGDSSAAADAGSNATTAFRYLRQSTAFSAPLRDRVLSLRKQLISDFCEASVEEKQSRAVTSLKAVRGEWGFWTVLGLVVGSIAVLTVIIYFIGQWLDNVNEANDVRSGGMYYASERRRVDAERKARLLIRPRESSANLGGDGGDYDADHEYDSDGIGDVYNRQPRSSSGSSGGGMNNRAGRRRRRLQDLHHRAGHGSVERGDGFTADLVHNVGVDGDEERYSDGNDASGYGRGHGRHPKESSSSNSGGGYDDEHSRHAGLGGDSYVERDSYRQVDSYASLDSGGGPDAVDSPIGSARATSNGGSNSTSTVSVGHQSYHRYGYDAGGINGSDAHISDSSSNGNGVEDVSTGSAATVSGGQRHRALQSSGYRAR